MEIRRKRVGDSLNVRLKKDNKGTTMVETLVAFTVLAIVLTMLFKVVQFSSRLRVLAVDSAQMNSMFMREIYKNDESIDTSDDGFVKITRFVPGTVANDGNKAAKFAFVLDVREGKTDINRNYGKASISDMNAFKADPPRFLLNGLGAKSYLCTDDVIDEEEIAAPVVMNFFYETPAAATVPGESSGEGSGGTSGGTP